MASFIVFYYGNTGSSWLVETLGSAPGVIIPAFEPVEEWAWKASDEDKLEWIRNALSPPLGRGGEAFESWVAGLARSPQFNGLPDKEFESVGFKMNGQTLDDLEGLIRTASEVGAKAIFLERDNRLKHALSLYRYHEEFKSQFDHSGVRPSTKVDFKKFERWLIDSHRLHSNQRAFRALAASMLGWDRMIDVTYEDFITSEGKAAVIDRLAGFLGLDRSAIGESGFAKATPDGLQQAVVNYGQFRKRFIGTPLEVYLDDWREG
ncbi:MAG: hypothetical protein WAM81_10010 [Acidimicrobiia bacterium]